MLSPEYRNENMENTELEDEVMSGKFLIEKKDNGFYIFRLLREDGSLIARSRECWDLEDCEHCIRSCRKRAQVPLEDQTKPGFLGVPLPKFELFLKKGTYRFRQWTSVGRMICLREDFETKEECLQCIEDVRRYALEAEVEYSEACGKAPEADS